MRVIPIAALLVLGCIPQLFGQERKDKDLPKRFTNSIGMEFVLCPSGTFVMGSPGDEAGRRDYERQHEVRLSNAFYLGVCEVTQGEWKSVMETEPWKGQKHVPIGCKYPAMFLLFKDAQAFCTTLSAREGKEYRIPTEAEWEYACRAGTKTTYSFGDSDEKLTKYAWFEGNAQAQEFAHQVRTKLPNSWGLYDMHGNVWEWCQDWLDDYPSTSVTDPQGPTKKSYRIVRGGGWDCDAVECRSACRFAATSSSVLCNPYGEHQGFRVVLVPSQNQIEAKESQ